MRLGFYVKEKKGKKNGSDSRPEREVGEKIGKKKERLRNGSERL